MARYWYSSPPSRPVLVICGVFSILLYIVSKRLQLAPSKYQDNDVKGTYYEIKSIKDIKRGNFDKFVELESSENHEEIVEPKSRAKILLWYVKPRYINNTPKPKSLENCAWKCSVTTNTDYHNISSALMFSAIITNVPVPKRYGDQVFVVHNHEPQCAFYGKRFFHKPEWKNQLNWTMWYRFDSDIHEPYGLIKKRSSLPQKNYEEIYQQKTKMAAWVVSNCQGQSNRNKYAKLLQQHGVDIDIYGSCGNKTCARGNDPECLAEISKKYKFYLSFESSFCPDYITEKFFRYYRGDMVVVARGGANYSKEAPEGTFINTQDYNTIKDLADHLKRLSDNKEEYISLLKRKDNYESIYEDYPHLDKRQRPTYMTYHYEQEPFCELCKRLWNVNSYRKTYTDFGEWFDKAKCFPPRDFD